MNRREIALIKETRQEKIVPKIMNAMLPYLTLKKGDKVAIKINLSGFREIYANTNYETVESLILFLKEKIGIDDIHVIEGSDGAYSSGKSTWEIFYKFKYKEVELNGATLINLDELKHDKVMTVQTLHGKKEINYVRYDCDYLINIVPPKTHNIFPAVLSIPNLSGFVKPEHRDFLYGMNSGELKKVSGFSNEKYSRVTEMAGRNFSELLKNISPSLTMIDGLYGMEGKGPVKGSPVFHGFSIASEDAVLADSLATFVMGFDSDSISYIKAAYESGLGNNRWKSVVGIEPGIVKFPYRPHPSIQKRLYSGPRSFSNGNRKKEFNSRFKNNNRNSDKRRVNKNASKLNNPTKESSKHK